MKKITTIILSLILLLYTNAFAHTNREITQSFIINTVTEPSVGSVGGEWAILSLARSDADVSDEYYTKYYEYVESYVKSRKGILHNNKYTEYSRLVLALSAIGKNPENVAGYNLLTPLGDFEKTVFQGINGAVWALISLDCKDYEIPLNNNAKTQATRDKYIAYILENQLCNGGFPISQGSDANIDTTAMAITALSNYIKQDEVKSAIDNALMYISDNPDSITSSENVCQIIVALTSIGISPADARFIENGKTLVDKLFEYSVSNGSFRHTLDSEGDLMATEQALYALAAIERFDEGRPHLFDMSDTEEDFTTTNESGLFGKHPDISKATVKNVEKSFFDISYHKDREIIEALAAREIIDGKTQTTFEPDATITRAEFAAIVVRSLGLTEIFNQTFDDVNESDWFYGYTATAHQYGIINGVSDTEFCPHKTITRQEAVVMVTRAASLCGMDTTMNDSAVRNVLAAFMDYISVDDWAKASLAFCYGNGILSDDEMEILPHTVATRAEISVMVYNLLDKSKLL